MRVLAIALFTLTGAAHVNAVEFKRVASSTFPDDVNWMAGYECVRKDELEAVGDEEVTLYKFLGKRLVGEPRYGLLGSLESATFRTFKNVEVTITRKDWLCNIYMPNDGAK